MTVKRFVQYSNMWEKSCTLCYWFLSIFLCTNFHYYLYDWKILEFEYNYSGKPFLKLKKSGGPAHIDFCVKELIRISLPIQCVEAVFIACRLTAELETIERVPLSFKSVFRYYVYFVFLLCCIRLVWWHTQPDFFITFASVRFR